jgi:NAD-dependent deacetylase sirtuin 5
MSFLNADETLREDTNSSTTIQSTGSQLPKSFKDELRKQFFARDRREKTALDSLIPDSSAAPEIASINLALPADFPAYLAKSKRILCLVGAGLSASSGISTFRDSKGKDKFWRDYQVSVLSVSGMFVEDPINSWWYYADRRRTILSATPNAGHKALAKLAKKRNAMLTVSQNVDGLLESSGMTEGHDLVNLHGSLLNVQCADPACGYAEHGNYHDPIVPGLTIPDSDISDPEVSLPVTSKDDLPHCPRCIHSLIRPEILWFGEDVPKEKLAKVDEFLSGEEKIDLMIVVGTSAMVWPAADFVHKARKGGAKVAVFDMNRPVGTGILMDADWFFQGDAAVTLPDMLGHEI